MATVKVLSDDEWQKMYQALRGETIFVSQTFADQLAADGITDVNGLEIEDYSFGGEPEAQIDFCCSIRDFPTEFILAAVQERNAISP